MVTQNTINNKPDANRTAKALPVFGSSGALGELGPLTNGQLLIGNTGNNPTAATLTAGSGISITNAAGSITISGGTGGAVLQTLYTSQVTITNCTTVIPTDDTKPQKTEGDEIFTITITPKSATNTLMLDFVAPVGCVGTDTNSIWAMAALFQDAGNDALNATWGCYGPNATNGSFGNLVLRHWMVAGTTSATTFKIRVGPNSGTNHAACVNGYNNARYFGGAAMATFTIIEFSA